MKNIHTTKLRYSPGRNVFINSGEKLLCRGFVVDYFGNYDVVETKLHVAIKKPKAKGFRRARWFSNFEVSIGQEIHFVYSRLACFLRDSGIQLGATFWFKLTR